MSVPLQDLFDNIVNRLVTENLVELFNVSKERSEAIRVFNIKYVSAQHLFAHQLQYDALVSVIEDLRLEPVE